MALNGCGSGVLLTAVVALLLVPVQYYVPDLSFSLDDETPVQEPPPNLFVSWTNFTLTHLPPLDLFFTVALIFLASLTYICEWIQRKLMERRIVKLNQYLGASAERLQVWERQQKQLENTLKMVHNATCEYNLLLFLLLRRQPSRESVYDKDFAEDMPFLSSNTIHAQAV